MKGNKGIHCNRTSLDENLYKKILNMKKTYYYVFFDKEGSLIEKFI